MTNLANTKIYIIYLDMTSKSQKEKFSFSFIVLSQEFSNKVLLPSSRHLAMAGDTVMLTTLRDVDNAQDSELGKQQSGPVSVLPCSKQATT